MDPLYRRAIIQSILGTILFIALIFWPAGTFHYWQGWLFLAVFSASTNAFGIYLALYDKPLLARRLAAGPQHEKERSQKIIVSLIFIAFFVLIVLPGLEHRYGCVRVSLSVTIAGHLLILLSFVFIFWVIRVNIYAASNIRVEKGQTVIDTGPYAFVRHPMYAGAILLFIAIPLALGAWWWTLLIIPCFPILAWRLLDEEKILRRDLRGYTESTHRVRS